VSYIEQSLSKNEYIKGKFKLHWFNWVWFTIWLLLGPLTIFITWIFAIIILIRMISTEIGVTNKRVILKTGLISRKTDEVKLGAIETVEIRQGIIGRIVSMGTVKVTGRGTSTLALKGISDPMYVKRRIEDAGDVEY
jgi:uncharacterized membrane protein YdbT with pleckstrin-like domain